MIASSGRYTRQVTYSTSTVTWTAAASDATSCGMTNYGNVYVYVKEAEWQDAAEYYAEMEREQLEKDIAGFNAERNACPFGVMVVCSRCHSGRGRAKRRSARRSRRINLNELARPPPTRWARLPDRANSHSGRPQAVWFRESEWAGRRARVRDTGDLFRD